jgi:hypothetical protein
MEMPDIQHDEHYKKHHRPCIPCIQTGPLTVRKMYFQTPVFITFFKSSIGKGGLV